VDWNPYRWFEASPWGQYLACQAETCPTTGRVHWQGYVHGNTPVGLETLKRELGLPGLHAEVRRGNHEEARQYCRKEESRIPGSLPIEIGDPPKQGNRTDLDALKPILAEQGLLGAFETDFSATVRFYRGFEKYLSLIGESRTKDTPQECHYFYGAPGTGKTRAVWESVPDASRVYACPTSSGKPWFDGYRPGYHQVILVDDYRGQWAVPFFLQLLDRYQLLLPVKGSHIHMGRAKIFITSNEPIETIYGDQPATTIAAIRRRFTSIVEYKALNMRLVHK